MLSTLDHAQRRGEFLQFDPFQEARSLVLSQRHHDLADLTIGGELPQRMDQDRRALQFKKLFALAFIAGRGRRHARAQSGCGNDDDYFHSGQRSINARRR